MNNSTAASDVERQRRRNRDIGEYIKEEPLTSLAIAGGVGFIFGVPRLRAASGGGATTSVFVPNTNLEQISDWLTKIVVGVGLVEAKNGAQAFDEMTNQAALWLFNMRHGSPTLIGATVLGSVVFGFLFAYLYTQLIITRLIVATDGVAEAQVTDDVRSAVDASE